MLSRADLFARLAAGHAARVTVVTPNRRLAQALVAEFDLFQAKRGLAAWEAPDILPLGAFAERLWEEALYAEAGAGLPPLLAPAQEQQLWQEIVEKAGLLAAPQAAALCREAWRLRHAWRIGPAAGNEDAQAFASWARQYEARTAGDTDAARLPDALSGLLARLPLPGSVVAYAFDILPPQSAEFLGRFALARCGPERRPGRATRASFASPQEELESAAAWARARLEAGAPRIGVVVPELPQRRSEVVRVFGRLLQSAFNVSLGLPLRDYPLVDAALGVLELAQGPLAFDRASALLRSPFLGGAEGEAAARARLDARLRRQLGAEVSLPRLVARAEGAPLLRRLLERLYAAAREDLFTDRSPPGWARRFSALLAAAGFPGERALDSAEFQARAKLNEVLGEFARLGRVSRSFSADRALAALKHLCAETLFQPESPPAPVQVLGVLEAAGMEFDHLWVSGLSDEAWPLAARPNPFLPVAAQRAAGIPEASAEGSLELDRRITAEWRRAAPEVVLSFARQEGERALAPSPLILEVPAGALEIPAYPRHRDLIFAARRLASLEDPAGPALAAATVRGGTRVLADQAACPFRAFARWRLGAQPLEQPAPGLDARARGSLLHALMKHLWASLGDSAALGEDPAPAIARAAQAAVGELGLEGRFAAIERARLERLAREWLEVEAARAPFAVVALEQAREISAGPLRLAARIDRMDRLASGAHVLLDYKSARNVTPKHWEGPRPHDPQLPLYACAAPEEIGAVAFARVRHGQMRLAGYSRSGIKLPKVTEHDGWPGLLARWRADTAALGASFAAGEARVDPKLGPQTCRLCDLHTLCRVYEKLSFLAEGEEAEEGE